MNFGKPIYAQIDGDLEAEKFRSYLTENGIKYTEEIGDYKFVGDLYVFSCIMTEDELFKANLETDALFYQ